MKNLFLPTLVLGVATTTAAASQLALQRLMNFGIADDGRQPRSFIQGADGCFYGTTSDRLSTNNAVFRMTPGGELTILAWLDCCPGALVQAADGSFYGAMRRPEPHSGAIFRVTATGAVSEMFSFSGTDGSTARVLVFGGDGNLYGTTPDGGSLRYGSIFKLTPGGEFTTLFSFSRTNGINPTGLVRAGDGTLFGTTSDWIGVNAPDTVFKLSPSGEFTTLLSSFTSRPWSLVLGSDGCLYGVDGPGGSNHVGAVFKGTLSGTVTTVAEFNGSNGSYPDGLVQGTDGNFYGTTSRGGPDSGGTIFKLTPGGELTMLTSFQGIRGNEIVGFVVRADGVIYGTTTSEESVPGSVFRLAPRPVITQLQRIGEGDVLSWSAFAGAIYGSSINRHWMLHTGIQCKARW